MASTAQHLLAVAETELLSIHRPLVFKFVPSPLVHMWTEDFAQRIQKKNRLISTIEQMLPFRFRPYCATFTLSFIVNQQRQSPSKDVQFAII